MTRSPATPSTQAPRKTWRHPSLILLLMTAVLVSGWTWWAEGHPRAERKLRVLAQDRLFDWFPDAMAPSNDGWHGLRHLSGNARGDRPSLLLVHGLDEPGDIWRDLVATLRADAWDIWELRYPNDQGIDRSAAYLAEARDQLSARTPVVLIGHSMGGLVIREFVTRRHDPSTLATPADEPMIRGVILVATPNHGSEWARLRLWLELRDHLGSDRGRRFSLFAALRDGTGAAKIDLRPDSDFLATLNARPWPAAIPIQIVGGTLLEPPPAMKEGLARISREIPSEELRGALHEWWSEIDDDLGDGVVSLASLRLTGAPPPILVNASHRGMLRRLLTSDAQPPAIPPILATLHQWSDVETH